MNRHEIGELVVMETQGNGFYDPTEKASIDPTLVQLIVQVNNAAPITYVYLVDGIIYKKSVGQYGADWDTSSLSDGDIVTYWWVGDPEGTVPSLCQTISKKQFTVYA